MSLYGATYGETQCRIEIRSPNSVRGTIYEATLSTVDPKLETETRLRHAHGDLVRINGVSEEDALQRARDFLAKQFGAEVGGVITLEGLRDS